VSLWIIYHFFFKYSCYLNTHTHTHKHTHTHTHTFMLASVGTCGNPSYG
jgi:hypothetical protein